MERTLACLGSDYWSYGFAANRAELDAVCRYSVEQYLAKDRVRPEDLFPPQRWRRDAGICCSYCAETARCRKGDGRRDAWHPGAARHHGRVASLGADERRVKGLQHCARPFEIADQTSALGRLAIPPGSQVASQQKMKRTRRRPTAGMRTQSGGDGWRKTHQTRRRKPYVPFTTEPPQVPVDHGRRRRRSPCPARHCPRRRLPREQHQRCHSDPRRWWG